MAMTETEFDEFMDQFVFIDTETTGLDYRTYGLLEMTYAVGKGKPITLYPVDSGSTADFITEADPHALVVNKWIERFTSTDDTGRWVDVPLGFGDRVHRAASGQDQVWMNIPESSLSDWDDFARALQGRTWVGANPRFDVNFIEEYFFPETLSYNHRLFDIQVFEAGLRVGHGWDFSLNSMSVIASRYASTKPDHTSYNDVLALREAFIAMINA